MDNYIPFLLIPFMGWGVRRLLMRRGDYGPLKRRTLAIGLGAFFVTEMGRSFYRPYIYANEINDGFVADTIGNSAGTVTAIFMILTLAGSGTPTDWRLVAMVVAGLVGYEVTSPFLSHPLDPNDLIATLIFGALSAAAFAWILREHGNSSDTVPAVSPAGSEEVE